MQNVQIASHIRSLCKEHKIPIRKLLSDCGIRSSLIYDLEKRDWAPSVKTVSDVADYFDVSIDYLVGRTEKPDVNR